MNEPMLLPNGNPWWTNARQALMHAFAALLAVSMAVSLPSGAQYILYEWWPRVAQDANLLIATEIALTAVLLLMFNVARTAWGDRRLAEIAGAAALVHAREKRSWLARWRERRLVKRLPALRDVHVLTLTGFDTFADPASLLRDPLRNAYEIRVMLLNPLARSARRRIGTLPRDVTLQSFAAEVEASIAYLSELRMLGKKVVLKFYEHEPFWKIAVLGDHVWVQYCHSGFEVKREPEYIFALNRASPRRGLFVPFYMHFLEQWNDPSHPHYDFDTRELVYHDTHGREIRRAYGTALDQPDRDTACQ